MKLFKKNCSAFFLISAELHSFLIFFSNSDDMVQNLLLPTRINLEIRLVRFVTKVSLLLTIVKNTLTRSTWKRKDFHATSARSFFFILRTCKNIYLLFMMWKSSPWNVACVTMLLQIVINWHNTLRRSIRTSKNFNVICAKSPSH